MMCELIVILFFFTFFLSFFLSSLGTARCFGLMFNATKLHHHQFVYIYDTMIQAIEDSKFIVLLVVERCD